MKRRGKKNFFSALIFSVIVCSCSIQTLNAKTIQEHVEKNKSDCMYLSDISYIKEKSFAPNNHTIHLDENENNDILTLKVNNKPMSFIKGICAWATSEIVYDLSEYQYDYFSSYLGVDISEQDDYFNTGVKFYIYTSDDGENWDEQYRSNDMYGWSEAEFANISITGAKYLKLTADDNSDAWWADWGDEAVFADAKLFTQDYEEDAASTDFIKTVAEYDVLIKDYADKGNYEITGQYETVLLQREFVNNVGYDVLQSLAGYSTEYRDTLEWLMGDTDTLRLYLTAGKPEGSYLNSIRVLSGLYTHYKSDLTNMGTTKYGTKYADLYRTMMLALSLTESGNVYLWIDGVNYSDALTRYEIYKNLHLHEGQSAELIENEIFESLTVEEMRWVMNTVIDDEEIVWLNDYVRKEGEGNTSPYGYISYTSGYDYSLEKYYSQENYETWNRKYHLSQYNITYQTGKPKLWIVFEEGSVCGGLSKTGSCIWGAYKGLPNTCVSQPAHCAYIYYSWDKDRNGIWNLGNDVSGWGQSGKTEHLNVRTMNDWGTGSYTTGWNANYILLAQAAQNEYHKYEKAEEILMLADIYKNDTKKLEEIYRQALAAEEINFDAWLGLVYLYEADSSRTEADYYELAQEIVQALTYYPYPMNDLLKLIKPHLTTIEYETMFTLLQTRALMTASDATEKQSIQAAAVRQVANQLLGNTDTSIASFSFDGENAGKIVLSSRFDGVDVAWEYSLDGGTTWNLREEHTWTLTAQELESITTENDIKVHIMGVDYSEENIYTIDIKDSAGLPADLYANDRENVFIGAVDTMEWKYAQDDVWNSYEEVKPDLTGDKTVIVRAGAAGVYMAQTQPATYQFTQENVNNKEVYVPIDRLSVHSYSSQQTGSDDAVHAIDGNIHTIWHTEYSGADTQRSIVIKLNEPIYLSALEYVPRQTGSNGRAENAELYVSMNGEDWTQAASVSGWENNAAAKMLRISESVQAQYVKFVTTKNWGDGRSFASAAMLNLFEDVTKKAAPTGQIVYDVTEATNTAVTAKLVFTGEECIITNNNGSDTYVFTQNGTFTFEFMDKYGNIGTATAEIDWIITEDTPTEPSEPSEPEDTPTEPSEPNEPEDTPTEPSEPSEPEDTPTEPSEPNEPEDTPTEPSEPSEPEDTPTEPSEPSEPEDIPTEPSEPSEPEDTPTEPSEPSEPEDTPTEPSEPSEPEDTPTEPSEPSKPEDTPTEPSEPSEPEDTPTEPSEPSKPEDTPTEPSEPSEPETKPSEPDTPKPMQFVYGAGEFRNKLNETNVIIKNDNVVIAFQKGSQINETAGITQYDFSAVLIMDYEKAALSGIVDRDEFVGKVCYAYSGTLPATASIQIFVGKEYAGKQVAYALLKSDKTIDEKQMQVVTVDANGAFIVTQQHCSEYVITLLNNTSQAPDTQQPTPDAEQSKPNAETSKTDTVSQPDNAETTAPKTGDNLALMIWSGVLLVCVVILLVFLKIKQK